MSNNKTLNTQFIFRVFIVSVIINAVACAAHLYHPSLTVYFYTLRDAPRIFIFTLWTGAVLFIPVCLILFFAILATKSLHREKTYFIVLVCSMLLPWFMWMVASKLFESYGDIKPIAAIASFSALVSIAFYYEFFMNEKKEPAV